VSGRPTSELNVLDGLQHSGEKRTEREVLGASSLEIISQRLILASSQDRNIPRGIIFTEAELVNIREFACDGLL
jgi:hypothetical protein